MERGVRLLDAKAIQELICQLNTASCAVLTSSKTSLKTPSASGRCPSPAGAAPAVPPNMFANVEKKLADAPGFSLLSERVE